MTASLTSRARRLTTAVGVAMLLVATGSTAAAQPSAPPGSGQPPGESAPPVDEATRQAAWAAFLADPDWLATKGEATTPLVGRIDTQVLSAVAYAGEAP